MSRSVSLMLFLTLAVPAAVAQTADTADLHGVVLDASGKPLAGHPMSLITPEYGNVIMSPTGEDGTFSLTGLPPGKYELRVFEPGGSTENPIASKQVTLAAGQKEQFEIRVGSASKLATGGTMLASTWAAIGIAVVLAVGLVVFVVVRFQRGSGAT